MRGAPKASSPGRCAPDEALSMNCRGGGDDDHPVDKPGVSKGEVRVKVGAAAVGFVPGPGRHLMLYVSSAATQCSYALAQVGTKVGFSVQTTTSTTRTESTSMQWSFSQPSTAGSSVSSRVLSVNITTIGSPSTTIFP